MVYTSLYACCIIDAQSLWVTSNTRTRTRFFTPQPPGIQFLVVIQQLQAYNYTCCIIDAQSLCIPGRYLVLVPVPGVSVGHERNTRVHARDSSHHSPLRGKQRTVCETLHLHEGQSFAMKEWVEVSTHTIERRRDWPPLSLLPLLVSGARNLRLYQYPVPEHLVNKLDLKCTDPCTTQRAKHPWMNLEKELWKRLPDSIWTDDPALADFFVVPHAHMGHKCSTVSELRTRYVEVGLAPYLKYLYYSQPFYNRSGGRDHMTVMLLENGPLCDCGFRKYMRTEVLAFSMLQSFIKIGYWGNRNSAMFGWEEGHDVALPQWGAAYGVSPALAHYRHLPFERYKQGKVPPSPRWQEVVSGGRKYSFGFAGTYWGGEVVCNASSEAATNTHKSSASAPGAALDGKHVCHCSPGIRSWLEHYLIEHCNTSLSSHGRCEGVRGVMGSSYYALCPAAWACWSSRIFHAIDRLVVPVIMSEGAIQPFEAILEWETFAVKLNTDSLLAGDVTQLEALHIDAMAVSHVCKTCNTSSTCPPACASLALTSRVRTLALVRSWMLYVNGNLDTGVNSALGLFLLELRCRQWYRKRGGHGRCLYLPWRQLLSDTAGTG